MVKKTLLSLAIAATTAGLAGCNLSSTDQYENKITGNPPSAIEMPEASSVYPVFAPENKELPVATDFVFASASLSDGTANTDVTPETFPVTTAINKLAGFSTIAPIYINFSDGIAEASVVAGTSVFLIRLRNAEDDADIDALDIKSIAANSVVMNSGQPVLDENGEPVVNPIADTVLQPVAGVDYEASVIDLNGQPAVRIQLNKPLAPKTKYIVALTNVIKGEDGTTATTGSPTYELVAGANVLPSASLGKVRDAVQAWEKIAGGYIAQYSTYVNGLNPAYPLQNQDNVILSYAFTTDGSQDVLKSYAAPGLFVKNSLSVAEAEALTDSLSGVQEGFSIVARKVYLAGLGNYSPTPADLADVPEPAVTGTKASPAYQVQLFNAIATADLGGASLTTAANAPKARTVTTINQAAVDAAINANFDPDFGASPAILLNAVGGSSSDIYTRYIQGTITLPDFLGGVEKTDLSGITDPVAQIATVKARVAAAMRADNNWSANTAVGAILDGALGNEAGSTPPKDVDGVSTNVTYRYPFPQTIGSSEVPFLLTMPDVDNNTACTTNNWTKVPTVIFVHGITSNRTASALFAAEMATQCVATVAIDLPLHGVAPEDGALTLLSLDTANAATTGSPWAGVAAASQLSITERHGNVWQDDNSIRKDMDYANDAGDSGSAFINLQNFGRTHDNLRQAVADLLNLNASLANIHTDIDTDKVFVVGHSLGGIVASAFVAANNDAEVQAFVGKSALNPTGLPKVQGLIMAGSGAHLTKLLENSPAFAPKIVGGLTASGLTQGTENYEKFLGVFQSLIDGVDPANTAADFGGVPVKLLAVEGGATVADFPDTTVPVFDYFADENTNPFASLVAPGCFDGSQTTGCGSPAIVLPSAGVAAAASDLAGSDGLKTVAADNVDFLYVPYTSGTHSSFAKPTSASDAAFDGIIDETTSLIQAAYN